MIIKKEDMIENHVVEFLGDTTSKIRIIRLVNEHMKEFPEENDTFYITVLIKDWNNELSPWPAKAVFGTEDFGSGANNTLEWIENQLIPYVNQEFGDFQSTRYVIAGYSLAGLFALWAAGNTNAFAGVVAASPSVWFPDWITYATKHESKADYIYLSLGDKEAKTKNTILSQVKSAIEEEYHLLQKSKKTVILEWNPGNHFQDASKRLQNGIDWCLNQMNNN